MSLRNKPLFLSETEVKKLLDSEQLFDEFTSTHEAQGCVYEAGKQGEELYSKHQLVSFMKTKGVTW